MNGIQVVNIKYHLMKWYWKTITLDENDHNDEKISKVSNKTIKMNCGCNALEYGKS
jgi:hypothetical protein